MKIATLTRRWADCEDPTAMLGVVAPQASQRKLRLYASACCRRLANLLIWSPRWWRQSEFDRRAIQVAELYADDLVPRAVLDEVREAISFNDTDLFDVESSPSAAIWFAVGDPDDSYVQSCEKAARHAAACAACHGAESHDIERKAQAHLLRDIFGDPFRTVSIKPEWLTRECGLVLRLTLEAYWSRALPRGTLRGDQLLVLADALEEAGCNDKRILNHLRGPGPHVAGCHVIDLLTGRS